MSRINVLDKAVVEQIAAGEVIERPASIVKELLENAIDAGSTRIDIVIENGGLSRIQITDNGDGIAKEDLSKAVLRHATSKILHAEDLYAVATMGFRGEALASISAVSRFSISSSNIGDGMGWSLAVTGGVAEESVEPVQHLKGTTIECRDLFFNMPARKKFLKSEKAETMSVVKVIEQVMLSFPTIHFTSTINGKKRYDIPAVDSPRMRIAQIAGNDLASHLIHCSSENEAITVDIYITGPDQVQARPRFQNLYVNLRRINNQSVSTAVKNSFTNFISGHLKPNWFCYLDVEPAKIDVNVHPTKAEIKFDNEKEIFSLIYRTVEKGIREKLKNDFSTTEEVEVTEENAPINPVNGFTEYRPPVSTQPFVAEKKRVEIHTFPGTSSSDNTKETKKTITFKTKPSTEEEVSQTSIPLLAVNGDQQSSDKGVVKEALWEAIPCFQLHKRYIISPVKEGMMLIDQHAAHERVLYEKVLDDFNIGGVDSQRLLFPVTIDLNPEEKETLLEMRELFDRSGFDIQDFGGNSVAVAAVPATGFVKSTQIKDAIQEMLKQYSEEDSSDILSSIHKRFAAAFACGAAIKFGHELRQEEMNSLMNSLFAAKNPHICPHGRPTITKLSLDDLKKRFLR